MAHLNEHGEVCHCSFGQYQQPLEAWRIGTAPHADVEAPQEPPAPPKRKKVLIPRPWWKPPGEGPESPVEPAQENPSDDEKNYHDVQIRDDYQDSG